MKWFKHETDAHNNLKLQSVIDTYGLEAYGYYWACVELVGLQSEDFKLKSEKNWKNYLKKFVSIETEKQEMYLNYFSEINLIDKKALKNGDLFIPKMGERSDDYTKRVRRVFVQATDNVPLEEKRREKKRIEEIELPIWLNKNKWEQWVSYLKEKKKKKPTSSTLELHIKKLSKNITGHVEMIDKAIDRGWSSVFVPEENKSNPVKRTPPRYQEPDMTKEDNDRRNVLSAQSKLLADKMKV